MSISTTDVNIILDRLEGLSKTSRSTSVAIPQTNPKDLAYLTTNGLFGQVPEEELLRFVGLGKLRRLAPGDWLFESGEPCDRLFAIRSGILEICRKSGKEANRAALLGVGEILGLLGSITTGKHRSGGRFPEGGEVLEIEGQAFVAALETLPCISAALVRSLAQRLIGAVKTADMSRASKRQLEGSLAHFDLAAVVQSLLANEHAAGTLTILDENDETVADVLLGCGRVVACRFGENTELPAFQQLFLTDHSKHRFFYMESEEAGRAAECCEIGLGGLSGVGLLMDCARLVDENRQLEQGPLGNGGTRIQRLKVKAEWHDRSSQALYRRLMKLMVREVTIDEILRKESESRFRILSVLSVMYDMGQIEILEN